MFILVCFLIQFSKIFAQPLNNVPVAQEKGEFSSFQKMSGSAFCEELQKRHTNPDVRFEDWLLEFHHRLTVGTFLQDENSAIFLSRTLTVIKQDPDLHLPFENYRKNNPMLMDKWMACAITTLNQGKFNTQSLSCVLHALAKLDIQPTQPFIETWFKIATAQLLDFNPQNLANTLYALARLQIQPAQPFVAKWFQSAINKIRSFNKQNLFDALHALPKLKMQPPEPFVRAWFEMAEKHFFPIEILRSIGPFSKLGIIPPQWFVKSWFQNATEQLPKWVSRDLSSCVYTLGIMNHLQDQQSPDPDPTKPDFKDPKFIEFWFRIALRQLPKFNDQDLSNSLYGLKKLGIHPPQTFIQNWFTVALEKLSTFHPRSLSISLQALAKLGIQPSDGFFKSWFKAASNFFEQFSYQDTTGSLYSFALFEKPLNKKWRNKFNKKIDLLVQPGSKFRIEELHCLYLSMKYYNFNPNPCIAKHLKILFADKKKEIYTSSRLQQDVYTSLREYLYFEIIEQETWIDCIASRVDIYLPNRQIIIEIDGPFHFFESTKIYKPQTVLRDELLQRAKLHVVHVPYFDWIKMNERPAEKKRYWKRVLGPLLHPKPKKNLGTQNSH